MRPHGIACYLPQVEMKDGRGVLNVSRRNQMKEVGITHKRSIKTIQFNSMQKNFIWYNNYFTHTSASKNPRDMREKRKNKQFTRATYYLRTTWGCTAQLGSAKNPPPTSSVPFSPTFFWLSHLIIKRDISLGYTIVSIIGYFNLARKKK